MNQSIEYTNLKADASEEDILKLCQEAVAHEFYGVCVNPGHVGYAKACIDELQSGSPRKVKVISVVGFPLGATTIGVKGFEAMECIMCGAGEVDMVINIGALKEGRYDYVVADIKKVVDRCKGYALVKVILETCLLTEEEIRKGCELAKEAGADFVKTSTGMQAAGATIEHVTLMRQIVGSELGVKAAGGIRDKQTALALIEAGADRIGTSSILK